MYKLFETPYPLDNLPKICVHVPQNDSYSEFYTVDDVCSCGQVKWYNSNIEVTCSTNNNIQLIPQKIQKCASCNEIRMARLKKKYEKIIDTSNKLLENLRKISNDDHEWFAVCGNMYAKLAMQLYGQDKFKEVLNNLKQVTDEL